MGKSKLSLSDAIKHCEEVAEAEEQKYKDWKGDYLHLKKIDSCLECASEHRQLAEWLRELKKLRADRDRLLGIFEKIRADIESEIISHSGTGDEVIQAYADGLKKGLRIIDKYKAESEEEE